MFIQSRIVSFESHNIRTSSVPRGVLEEAEACPCPISGTHKMPNGAFSIWIIIGSDRRPETEGIEGKIYRFRSGRVRVRDRVRVRCN